MENMTNQGPRVCLTAFSCPEGRCGGFKNWIHSCVFLKGCIAGVAADAQFGFHFLFFFSSFGLSPGQAPSVVMSKASLRRMPTLSRHVCAKRSSPIGPYFPSLMPTFHFRVCLQESMF